MLLPESKKREKELARILKKQKRPAHWSDGAPIANFGFTTAAPALPHPSHWDISA
jgi:hypothetical protein